MITQKTKYALKALMALGSLGKDGALTIEQVAKRSGGPKRFLEHILLDLRKAGYVGAKRGRAGGYFLIREPERISLGELLQQIDGPIAPLPCLSRRSYRKCDDCADEETCQLRHVFGSLFYNYLLLIESLTLRDLLERPETIGESLGVEAGEAPARENGASRQGG
ncbi:Rrf2 family transcriptional regulator [Poseidonocella sp. HB161398]|uniref:RrF2 family transcriptional regulator n=1 Tax=Poseidonocella sp. HB161398 TaxID=2320855 RepID=UPI001109E7A0|nr:Rrf2 family transcriptional regulator [Poseidonocella sp. HB161398]